MATRSAGIRATNTTTTRDNLSYSKEHIESIGKGGLSGAPITKKSTEVIRYLHEKSGGTFPIIGVGGIMTPEDAYEKIAAGASLIQLYSGFIYEGPSLIRRICKYLAEKGGTSVLFHRSALKRIHYQPKPLPKNQLHGSK